MGSLRSSMMKEKEDELFLFLEMRKRERERNNLLVLQNSDEFDAQLGSKTGHLPISNIASTSPAAMRKNATHEFLNSQNDRNDYDWLMTPPGTPLFHSLEMESQITVISQLGAPKSQPLDQKFRLVKPQEHVAKSNLPSRQTASSTGLNTSITGLHRTPLFGGSRSVTPTRHQTLSVTSRSTQPAAPKATVNTSSKPSIRTPSKPASATISRPARSVTPNSRPTIPSGKATVPPRSSTPVARSSSRSSTPTTRQTIPSSKLTSRPGTLTRGPSTTPAAANISGPVVKSPSSSSVTKLVTSTVKNPAPPRSSSPTVKPRPCKPADIPGFSLDAPPNLRTSLPDRPIAANRGRLGVPNVRSSSVEALPNGKVRRQSCSPSRGRPPNNAIHNSGSSVPALNRLHAKANDNVSPAMVGTKTVERLINMRKLAPPKQDDKHSPHKDLSRKSSPESSGFGRTLSKKSLDMAIRHMDIRGSIAGNLRPLMSNIPASSMYSVRSGPARRSMTGGMSESPIATSSNASSEMSVNNNALCINIYENS